MEVWEGEKGRKVYGARKIWLELNSQGIAVARCTVERLMRELGIRGASPGRKRPPATLPGDPADRPSDLLERCFDAAAPNRRWVADITYVQTFSGCVYTAFVMDLFARRVLGWQVADHLRSDLALDALEMAIWVRRDEDLGGVVSIGRPPGGYVADTWLVTNASGIRVVGKTVVGAPAGMFQAEAEGLTVLLRASEVPAARAARRRPLP